MSEYKALEPKTEAELQHWKYIKKIGDRYFYTWEELQAYYHDEAPKAKLAGKKAAGQLKSSGRKAVGSAKKQSAQYRKKVQAFGNRVRASKNQPKEYFKSKYDAGQKFLAKYSKSATDSVKKTAAQVDKKIGEGASWLNKKTNGAFSNKSVKQVEKRLAQGQRWLKKQLSTGVGGIDRTHSRPSATGNHKYLTKKVINGKTRYFYTQDELDAYNKRSWYQDQEPYFMKGVKRSSDPYTAQEDAVRVNPNYDPDDSDSRYEYNCAECTAIYELRRRGYDVESNGVYNGTDNVGSNIQDIANGIKYNTDLRYKLLWENSKMQKVPAAKSDDEGYQNIVNEIKKNPPGSRGDFSFQWKNGGGHSVVWELDSNNNIRILDAQMSGSGKATEIDLKKYCKYIDHSSRITSLGSSGTRVVRTDNLQPKKDVLNICQSSSKENTTTENVTQERIWKEKKMR